MRGAVGIDGAPGGWIAAHLVDDGLRWQWAAIDGIADLLPAEAAIAIDMPIGLLDVGLRDCDALARSELPGAGARVFTTPPRPVLELGLTTPNADAQALSRRLTGQGVSRQALGLSRRILVLDDALAAHPELDAVEAHPELAFAAMTGRVLPSKHTAAGVDDRVAALRQWRTDAAELLAHRPPRTPLIDAMDALAALWTAVRWRDGRARTLPPGAARPPFVAV